MKSKCEECDFKSKTKTLLIRHKEMQHEAKTYKCEECDFKSKTKTLLTRRNICTYGKISRKTH